MKKTLILMAFFIGACGAPVSALSSPDTEYPSPMPTATIYTTPTPEYRATAEIAETQMAIAEATSQAVERVMVQATNDEAQRQHEAAMINAQGTQQADANAMVQLSWTATAYQTAIPLTATAQVDNSTAIASYSTMTIAQITATAYAPTQVVANANAQTQANLAPLFAGVQIFAIFAIGVFLLFAAWMMRWYWMREDARAEAAAAEARANSPRGIAEREGFKPVNFSPNVHFVHPVETPTVVNVRTDYGGGMGTLAQTVVPCTKEQLLQFAENTITKGWGLGINQWEGGETLFTRNTYKVFRAWLMLNKFAVSTGAGILALTDAGKEFFEGVLNTSQLPNEYQFGEMQVAQ